MAFSDFFWIEVDMEVSEDLWRYMLQASGLTISQASGSGTQPACV